MRNGIAGRAQWHASHGNKQFADHVEGMHDDGICQNFREKCWPDFRSTEFLETRDASMSSQQANAKSTSSPVDSAGRLLARYCEVVSPSIARWAPLPLRLIVGYGFAAHGFAKLLRGPENFTGLLDAMGLPMPYVLAWITILTEIAGGFWQLSVRSCRSSAFRWLPFCWLRSSRFIFNTDFHR
jgi:DoxX